MSIRRRSVRDLICDLSSISTIARAALDRTYYVNAFVAGHPNFGALGTEVDANNTHGLCCHSGVDLVRMIKLSRKANEENGR